jgi:transcriptional regulator with XRE-family HTH domain
MTKEQEIENEFNRISKQLEAAYKSILKKINWQQCDLAGAMDITPPTVCNFLNGRANNSLRTIITCFYYLGFKVTISIKPFNFQAYKVEKKIPEK